MAQQVKIAGALFQDVPSISVPDANDVWHEFTDTSDADAVAADIASGKTAYAGGVKLVGTGESVEVEPLSVTANGTYTAQSGHAYSPVTVNVEGGGGGGAGNLSDPIRFFDYDGTLVASYSADEFLALDAMPENPDRTDIGLTAQGWNWTLADAQEYVGKYGQLNIGQTYVPTDGKTHLWIHIGEHETGDALTMTVRYTQTVSQGVTIDWGDGTAPQTYTGTTATNRTHTYAAPGSYDITLEVTSGTVSFDGTTSSSGYAIYGSKTSTFAKYRIKKAWFGRGVTGLGVYSLYYCQGMESVIIPSGVTSIDQYSFTYCYILNSVAIPSNVTSIGNDAFQYCHGLNSVAIPSNVTSIGNGAFNGCDNLESATIPSSVTSIGSSAFSGCYSLKHMVIPSSVTSISSNMLQYCYNLKHVVIPSSVTSIGSSAFSGCYSLKHMVIPSSVTKILSSAFLACGNVVEYHIIPTTPPTLASTNAFNSIPADCTMYVPYSEDHSILAAYQAASNWSTYASRMVEEPQS